MKGPMAFGNILLLIGLFHFPSSKHILILSVIGSSPYWIDVVLLQLCSSSHWSWLLAGQPYNVLSPLSLPFTWALSECPQDASDVQLRLKCERQACQERSGMKQENLMFFESLGYLKEVGYVTPLRGLSIYWTVTMCQVACWSMEIRLKSGHWWARKT